MEVKWQNYCVITIVLQYTYNIHYDNKLKFKNIPNILC